MNGFWSTMMTPITPVDHQTWLLKFLRAEFNTSKGCNSKENNNTIFCSVCMGSPFPETQLHLHDGHSPILRVLKASRAFALARGQAMKSGIDCSGVHIFSFNHKTILYLRSRQNPNVVNKFSIDDEKKRCVVCKWPLETNASQFSSSDSAFCSLGCKFLPNKLHQVVKSEHNCQPAHNNASYEENTDPEETKFIILYQKKELPSNPISVDEQHNHPDDFVVSDELMEDQHTKFVVSSHEPSTKNELPFNQAERNDHPDICTNIGREQVTGEKPKDNACDQGTEREEPRKPNIGFSFRKRSRKGVPIRSPMM